MAATKPVAGMGNFHNQVKGIFGTAGGAQSTNSFGSRMEVMATSTQDMLQQQIETNKHLAAMVKGQKQTQKAIGNIDTMGITDLIMAKFLGKLGLVVTGVGGGLLGGLGKHTKTAVGKVRGTLTSLLTKTSSGLLAFATKPVTTMMAVISAATGKAMGAMNKAGRALTTSGSKALGVMKTAIKVLPKLLMKLAWPITALMGIVDGFKGFTNAKQILGKGSVTLADKVMSSIGSAVNGVLLGIPNWIIGKFGGKNLSTLMVGIKDKAYSAVKSIGTSVTAALFSIGSMVSDSVKGAFSSIPSVPTVLTWLPNVGGLLFDGFNFIKDTIVSSITNLYQSGRDWLVGKLKGLNPFSSSSGDKVVRSSMMPSLPSKQFVPSNSNVKSATRPMAATRSDIVVAATSGNANKSTVATNKTEAASAANAMFRAAPKHVQEAMTHAANVSAYAALKMVENDSAAKLQNESPEERMSTSQKLKEYLGMGGGGYGALPSYGGYSPSGGGSYSGGHSGTGYSVTGPSHPTLDKSPVTEDQARSKLSGLTQNWGKPRGAPGVASHGAGAGVGRSGSSALTDSNGRVMSTAATNMSAVERAFLDTVAVGNQPTDSKSRGFESPDYNTIAGGTKFEGYADHPRRFGKVGTTAAGRYQFVKGTWDETVTAYNAENKDNPITDFSPKNQDKAALFLAKQRYSKYTKGGNLIEDLQSGKDVGQVFKQLGGTWEIFQKVAPALSKEAFKNNLSRNEGYVEKDTQPQNKAIKDIVANNDNVKQAQSDSVRKYPIAADLKAQVSKTVMQVLGPDYEAEVYSGGQDAAGRRKLGSSPRHNEGNAADLKIYRKNKDGSRTQVSQEQYGMVSQEWLANKRGSIGLQMGTGGIHMDTHTDKANYWNYNKKGGIYVRPEAQAMVAAGKKGIRPALAMTDKQYAAHIAAQTSGGPTVANANALPSNVKQADPAASYIHENSPLFSKTRGSKSGQVNPDKSSLEMIFGDRAQQKNKESKARDEQAKSRMEQRRRSSTLGSNISGMRGPRSRPTRAKADWIRRAEEATIRGSSFYNNLPEDPASTTSNVSMATPDSAKAKLPTAQAKAGNPTPVKPLPPVATPKPIDPSKANRTQSTRNPHAGGGHTPSVTDIPSHPDLQMALVNGSALT